MEFAQKFILFSISISAVSCCYPILPPKPISNLKVVLDVMKSNLRQEPPQELSFQVEAMSLSGHFCLVSLLEVDNLQIGITSATCLGAPYQADGLEPAMYLIGSLPSEDDDHDHETLAFQIRRVVKVITHEDHVFGDTETLSSNIAILFIDAPFLLSENLRTTHLPEVLEEPQGVVTTFGGNDPTVEPIAVQLKVLTDTQCAEIRDDLAAEYLPDEMFCGQTLGEDYLEILCQIDGIAVVSEDDRLTGFVGSAYTVCRPEQATPVYVQVSKFVEWIHTKVATFRKQV